MAKRDDFHSKLLFFVKNKGQWNAKSELYSYVAIQLGETGVGWDKFWLGQCPSGPNESPDGETNYVFKEHMTTAFIGATRIINVRFASVVSQKITICQQK